MTICASFSNPENIESFLTTHPEVEIIEIRMDLMALSDDDIARIFSLPVKTIATCRPNNSMNDKQRFSLLKKALLAGALYVDIELESSFIEEILEIARENSRKSIVSYHNFEETPLYESLRKIVFQAAKFNPEIIKIACLVNDEKDICNLKRLYNDFDSVVVVGMGEKGVETRIHACKWGAPFTYAAADKEALTAPGQLDYKEIQMM